MLAISRIVGIWSQPTLLRKVSKEIKGIRGAQNPAEQRHTRLWVRQID